jgi:hypothetical protein
MISIDWSAISTVASSTVRTSALRSGPAFARRGQDLRGCCFLPTFLLIRVFGVFVFSPRFCRASLVFSPRPRTVSRLLPAWQQLPPCTRYCGGRVVVVPEEVEGDLLLPRDHQTARVVQDIANAVCEHTSFKVDLPSAHSSGWIPLLDIHVRVLCPVGQHILPPGLLV